MLRTARAALVAVLAFILAAATVAALQVGGRLLGSPSGPPAGGPAIRVYRAATGAVTSVPLEDYVAGVVAAEMPADFQMEALKAQAVAARTNAVRALARPGRAPGGADITDDPRRDQAYRSPDELRLRWGAEFPAKYARVLEAVRGTRGLILLYGGRPIEALFFSTSNGYTESAKELWGRDLPYLQSVPSPWDAAIAPRFKATKTVTIQELADALHLDAVPATAAGAPLIQVLAESPTRRVKEIRVGDKRMSGNDFRQALGLNSTSFTWRAAGGRVTFETVGYGHGVGMSQYGAEALARQGRTAEEILAYYYRGTALGSVDSSGPAAR